MSAVELVILSTNMSEEMKNCCVLCANKALETVNTENDIACYIKKEFDSKYYPSWHCIVGQNFGWATSSSSN